MSPLDGLFRAQLGQTSDPKELVPGDPDAIFTVTRQLREQGNRFEATADDLGRIRTPGWFGEANNAFWDKFSPERLNWLKAADAMADAAAALTKHAEVLAGAQWQAAEAIELWERGVAATEAAQARHDVAVGMFIDPGGPLRKNAQELLDRARLQLDQAGDDVARKLRSGAGADGDSPSWLSKARGAVENDNNLWEGTAAVEGHLGDLGVYGNARLEALGWAATVEASAGSQGLNAEIAGEAFLARAEIDGKAELGLAEAAVKTHAMAGGEANAEVGIGLEGVDTGFEVSAGAKAETDGGVSVAGVGVGYKAEARVGVGIEAEFTAGMQDGKFVIGGEFGAALGLGGSMGGYISIDPGKVVETVNDVAESVGTVGNLVEDAQAVAAEVDANQRRAALQ